MISQDIEDKRLAVNVGIVLVFVAFYFRFLKHSVSAGSRNAAAASTGATARLIHQCYER